MLPLLFMLLSLFILGSGIALFLSEKLLNSVLALTSAFIGSSLLFFYLGRTFIGLLQLFVLVGGLSTYLIVAVATDEESSEINRKRFIAVLFIVALSLSLLLFRTAPETELSGNYFQRAAVTALNSYYPLLLGLSLLLFSAVVGSIIVIKRLVRLVV